MPSAYTVPPVRTVQEERQANGLPASPHVVFQPFMSMRHASTCQFDTGGIAGFWFVRQVLGGAHSRFGFMENAEYLKWRELSVTFSAPKKWANAFAAERMSLTLSGRNLATSRDTAESTPRSTAKAKRSLPSATS